MIRCRLIILLWLIIPFSFVVAQQPLHVANTEPRTPEEERKLFKLPPGFEVQLVASEPDIQKPMNICFDGRGRLWVTGSTEYPFPAKDTESAQDTVKILENIDWKTGKAGKVTTFADHLNIPIGLQPLHDKLLVFSIPQIYSMKFGTLPVPTKNYQPLITGFGLRDTHGMTNNFNYHIDGWVYACHGYANDSKLKGTDGSGIRLQSGNIYRFKPDGSRLEQVTFGQVNPFGLAFDPLGQLFSSDCHTRPVMLLMPGACYDSFGKPHDGLGYAPEICKHDHGSTAIAGIAYYSANHFPKEYSDRLFIGNVVTNRINQDKVERVGAGVEAIELPDFLTSDDPWFRPVDIKIGPDGAMYIADFYNRIIGHYEVPLTHPGRDRTRGRIWRIVYTGKNSIPPHEGNFETASERDLRLDLAGPNLVVRTAAAHELVRRNLDPRMDNGGQLSFWSRTPTLWVMERTGRLTDSELQSYCSKDKHVELWTASMQILRERKELSKTGQELIQQAMFGRHDALVRRYAAEVWARHTDPSHIPDLIKALNERGLDDFLRHALRISLRNQFLDPKSWQALKEIKPNSKQKFIVADICLGLRTEESGSFLLDYLKEQPGMISHSYTKHISRFAPENRLPEMIEYIEAAKKEHTVEKVHCLEPITQGLEERGLKMPAPLFDWFRKQITLLISSQDKSQLNTALSWAGKLKLTEFWETELRLLHDKSLAIELRQAAAMAILQTDTERAAPILGAILAQGDESMPLRSACIEALASITTSSTRNQLSQAIITVPEALQLPIARSLAQSKEGCESLLELVEKGKTSARLLIDKQVASRLSTAKVSPERVSKLNAGLPTPNQKLAETMARLQKSYRAEKADEAAGKTIFNKQCAICHTLANQGAKIGPQLDGIGTRGLERLLEDVLDTNRNVDQAFRSTIIEQTDGRIITGLILREEGEVITLSDEKGQETRIAKSKVAERKTSNISPMPANFAEQLSKVEIHSLMKYLLSQRVK